ncbi:MFS general substrate transporter [Daedalea quercina L-15889]|uniref:MFS general substrate transporter n=1 Tax=Daedalea quercina L-15889 TaxID=1314783 RepID=A0A165KPK9_9APHY|nr:MFS general substrate transporter [Daedalea quercina L-15889]
MSKLPSPTISIANIGGLQTESKDGVLQDIPSPPALTAEQQRRLWRKVDARLIPMLTLMYLCSYLDRGNARIQGLTKQLNLTGNQFNIVLDIMSTPGYIIRWLPSITVSVVSSLTSSYQSYPQLVGARMCLAIAESGFFPGVVYYMTLWYPRHMLQVRVALFYGGATVSGAFSGVLAYGISFMSGTAGFLGWSWIFIIEGTTTAVVGAIAFLVLVDFPDTAAFLTEEEREFILWTKSQFLSVLSANQDIQLSEEYDNSSVGEEEHFEFRHFTAALCDWQIWVQIIVYWAISAPLNGITLFLPFGYDPAISQLLTVPPYVCATIVLIIFAAWSDHIKMRSPFILAGLLLCVIGFSINISAVPIGVKYFGVFFCVIGPYAAFPGLIAWLGNNLVGQYKRGIGMALQQSIGNFAGAVASNIYLAQDAPRYVMGHALELMFIGIGLVTLPILVLTYKRINARREVLWNEMEEKDLRFDAEELRRMGNRAPDFRYTL